MNFLLNVSVVESGVSHHSESLNSDFNPLGKAFPNQQEPREPWSGEEKAGDINKQENTVTMSAVSFKAGFTRALVGGRSVLTNGVNVTGITSL